MGSRQSLSYLPHDKANLDRNKCSKSVCLSFQDKTRHLLATVASLTFLFDKDATNASGLHPKKKESVCRVDEEEENQLLMFRGALQCYISQSQAVISLVILLKDQEHKRNNYIWQFWIFCEDFKFASLVDPLLHIPQYERIMVGINED